MDKKLYELLFDPTIGKMVAAVVGIVIVVVVVKFVQKSLSLRIKDKDTRYRTRKFISFIGYIAGILLLGAIFSDKLGGLTVALGVAGAGIAFALQEVIASIAGWFAISFAHFYKTGHRVQLGGIKGDVIDIGVLRTTIMEVGEWVNGDLYNGRVVRVANSFVFKEPVYNYSGDFPFLWDEMIIPIKHGSDINLAKTMLYDVTNDQMKEYADYAEKSWNNMVKKFLIEPAQVNPMITMAFDENFILFTVRYVVDYKKRRSAKDQLFTGIMEAISQQKDKVEIASTSLDITLFKSGK